MEHFLKSNLEALSDIQIGPEMKKTAIAKLVSIQDDLEASAQEKERLFHPEFPRKGWRLAHKSKFDIFLSYSSKDAAPVLGLYRFLKGNGYSVYLDCFDRLLNPKVVNRFSETVIRRRLIMSRSLIVATSQNMPSSAWVPWELGFTDGLSNKVAVLYIAPKPGIAFGRQSYFELYPMVGPGIGTTKPKDLQIFDPPGLGPYDWNQWVKSPRAH